MVSILCKHDTDQKIEIFIDDILRFSGSYNGLTCLNNIELSEGKHIIYIRQVSSINKWYWILTSLNPKEWHWLFYLKIRNDWFKETQYVGYDWDFAQTSMVIYVNDCNEDNKINLLLKKEAIIIDNIEKNYCKFYIESKNELVSKVNNQINASKNYKWKWRIKQTILQVIIILYFTISYFIREDIVWDLTFFDRFALVCVAGYFCLGFFKIFNLRSTQEELELLNKYK